MIDPQAFLSAALAAGEQERPDIVDGLADLAADAEDDAAALGYTPDGMAPNTDAARRAAAHRDRFLASRVKV